MGELVLTNQSVEDILGLLIASDELLLEELFEYIQDYLIKGYNSWIQQNFVLVLNTTPGLGNMNCNRANWNQENYEALKKTLSQFIPLIRFVKISRAEFYDQVRPYKAIIPKNLYEEIKEFYYKDTLPKSIIITPRRPASTIINPASTIIKPELVTIVANWIDRNDSNSLSSNNNYKFNLIYLKSRDGFDCATFNNKCSGQGPFVVLVRVESKKIYGGYNPIGYALRSNKWISSSNSFIFSFENDQDIYNMKIGRLINENRCIYENYHSTFIDFGYQLFIKCYYGSRLFLENNCEKGFYDIFNCIDSLLIEEIEVFGVVKI
ncbi:19000_t:CDS:2 [Funneliformis geosporum]|nr:19000_t:CDS:2 [Funneliformis geosporum]